MTLISVAKREELGAFFDTNKLPDTQYKITITPVSEAEADEIEFRSLKGIAGKPLDIDEIRKERLKL